LFPKDTNISSDKDIDHVVPASCHETTSPIVANCKCLSPAGIAANVVALGARNRLPGCATHHRRYRGFNQQGSWVNWGY
jgi:hypothetical protein